MNDIRKNIRDFDEKVATSINAIMEICDQVSIYFARHLGYLSFPTIRVGHLPFRSLTASPAKYSIDVPRIGFLKSEVGVCFHVPLSDCIYALFSLRV